MKCTVDVKLFLPKFEAKCFHSMPLSSHLKNSKNKLFFQSFPESSKSVFFLIYSHVQRLENCFTCLCEVKCWNLLQNRNKFKYLIQPEIHPQTNVCESNVTWTFVEENNIFLKFQFSPPHCLPFHNNFSFPFQYLCRCLFS